ncbi:Protein ripply3 [Sciurus carolinensis]|uniref:Protein ripply3 n=1 Tax=Sciurus carolinensis TaxID=30640 RepID=A0AA41MFH6_SCICA|nr:Protein ripply3 [Sciurus carolinensis]
MATRHHSAPGRFQATLKKSDSSAVRRQEYLRSSQEQVLASIPVQATIHFYNDESEPDSDEEEQEDTQT